MKKIYLSLFLVFTSTVIFAQATFRTNTGVNDWNLVGSWTLISGTDADGIPDADDDVFIQSGHTITLTANQECNNLHISGGTTSGGGGGADGTVTIGANTLELNGYLRTYWAAVGTTPALGTQDLTNGVTASELVSTTGGKISVVGNSRALTNASAWSAQHNAVDIEINLNPAQTVTLGTAFKGKSITINSGIVDMGANRLAPDPNLGAGSGNLTIASGATLLSSATGSGSPVISRTGTAATGRAGTFVLNGTLILTGASPEIQFSTINFNTGSVVEYSGTSQTLLTSSYTGAVTIPTYSKIIFSGSGTKTLSVNTTVNDTLSMQGTATAALGAFTMAYSASGTLEYAGSTAQNTGATPAEWPTINGPASLVINNASGVTLNATAGRTLTGVLNLKAGILTTSSSSLLTMEQTSSVMPTVITNTSYVSGPVKKIGNTDFTFPIGKSNGYVPIAVKAMSGTLNPLTDAFTAEYIRSDANTLGTITDPFIDHISVCDYWVLDRTSGTQSADVYASWNANSPCNGVAYVNDLATLALVHFNGTNWDISSVGIGGATGSVAAGEMIWPGVATFSPFALGSSSMLNPLPITLNYLNGIKQGSSNKLVWKITCTTSPTATMILERGSNSRDFAVVYTVNADALRCQSAFDHLDTSPLGGMNYYRLKMIDAFGKVTYSNVIPIMNGTKGFALMNIAPNPVVGGQFKLNITSAEATKINIVINDMQGKVVLRRTAALIAGYNQVDMHVENLAAGTYCIYGNTDQDRSQTIRFVKQ